MKGIPFLTLASCLVLNCSLNAQNGLKSGEAAGPVELVSPEGLHISMNNYAERLGTAVLFLSSRD